MRVVTLANGLRFEVHGDNRIELALLQSPMEVPDHIWEPQTTRLLLKLSRGGHALIGGAFIGDHAIPLAQALEERESDGLVHAFEPMPEALRRLRRNIELNGLSRITTEPLALWDREGEVFLAGELALASSSEEASGGAPVAATTINAYVAEHGVGTVDLIALDTEGGELRALRGASELLRRPAGSAPQIVFEIHRSHVDWSDGLERTEPIPLLGDAGYIVYAIRDYQGNVDMGDRPIELVPVDSANLEGPPHGFNLLATKERDLVERLGLRLVPGVSPKLLPHGDPAMHAPIA